MYDGFENAPRDGLLSAEFAQSSQVSKNRNRAVAQGVSQIAGAMSTQMMLI